MISCAVYGCANNTVTTTDPAIQYYYFPKHPLLAKEWINACCWNTDQIDTNTARICSVHFDNDSYTTEYKMLDYLGCYTKVLKYDAVPTLFLPNTTTTALIIQNDAETATISETTVAEMGELKNYIIYTFPTVTTDTEQQQLQSQSEHIPQELDPQNQLIEEQHQSETVDVMEEENRLKEKYKDIRTMEQLHVIKESNENMRSAVNHINALMEQTQTLLNQKMEEYKAKEAELISLHKQYSRLYGNTMTVQEEKNILSKVFSESQIKILGGRKKIYWSDDDMAIGYTIRHLSNKRCYMYLTKNLNIPLPALSSIKRWATLKKGEYANKMVKKDDELEEEIYNMDNTDNTDTEEKTSATVKA